jgi:hypothetical protein
LNCERAYDKIKTLDDSVSWNLTKGCDCMKKLIALTVCFSFTLSEILDNREYNKNLLAEYLDYINNEIPFERERFVSAYIKPNE